jgi:hypothetical protein
MAIDKLLREQSGIRLDIGCGANKQEGFVGMDMRPFEDVDIVHDINVHPWPLPDESVVLAICSHLVEHIPPVMVSPEGTRFPFIEFMDEVWRVLIVGGEFAISAPHGRSTGYLWDPTHCNPLDRMTWAYFDPEDPSGFYGFYHPKPWKIKKLYSNPLINMEVALVKREVVNGE